MATPTITSPALQWLVIAEEITLDEQWVGGILYTLRSTPAGYTVESDALGSTELHAVCATVCEAWAVYEETVGHEVARSQEFDDGTQDDWPPEWPPLEDEPGYAERYGTF